MNPVRLLPRVSFRSSVLVLIAVLTTGISSAVADETVLDRWYAALFDVDRPVITALLGEEAMIKLEDLGVTQTKAEFILALDEWEDITKDANLAWQLDPDAVLDVSQATALVCYQFPENELMIREAFRFRDGKIVSSVQTTIADHCEGF